MSATEDPYALALLVNEQKGEIRVLKDRVTRAENEKDALYNALRMIWPNLHADERYTAADELPPHLRRRLEATER